MGKAAPNNIAEVISATSGNVAAGAAVATIGAEAGKRNWITGFQCTASGATAGLSVNVTIAGLLGGSLTYTFAFPAGVLVGATPLIVAFDPPIPASADNTAISVSLPSSGAGGTNAATNLQGFRQ